MVVGLAVGVMGSDGAVVGGIVGIVVGAVVVEAKGVPEGANVGTALGVTGGHGTQSQSLAPGT